MSKVDKVVDNVLQFVICNSDNCNFVGCATSTPNGSSPRGYSKKKLSIDSIIFTPCLSCITISCLKICFLFFSSGAQTVLPIRVAPRLWVFSMETIVVTNLSLTYSFIDFTWYMWCHWYSHSLWWFDWTLTVAHGQCGNFQIFYPLVGFAASASHATSRPMLLLEEALYTEGPLFLLFTSLLFLCRRLSWFLRHVCHEGYLKVIERGDRRSGARDGDRQGLPRFTFPRWGIATSCYNSL
jgi:hypothetical protein